MQEQMQTGMWNRGQRRELPRLLLLLLKKKKKKPMEGMPAEEAEAAEEEREGGRFPRLRARRPPAATALLTATSKQCTVVCGLVPCGIKHMCLKI
jgi:hypothetical protein